MCRDKQTLSHHDLVLLVHLKKSVGVDEKEQSLEHSRLHVVDLHTSDGSTAALPCLSKELGHEGRGLGGENALVRREQIAANLKFQISSHLAC